MDKSTYDMINDYCTQKYDGILVQAERDYVLRKFLDSYYDAVENFKKNNNNKEPTSNDEKTIVSSLLNENTMNSYIDSAKGYYATYKASIEFEYQKRLEKPAYLKSIGINLLSNFIYSILLIIIFWVAKDQIATWLISLAG